MTELGHLLLADAVFKRLDWPREVRQCLYLGAIAPDAHRATIDVSYRDVHFRSCLLYTSPSPRDGLLSRMPSSA